MVTDREKLLRGLQNRINESRNRGGIAVPVALSTLSEALMAVKEKEPVEPKADGTSIYDVDGFIVCGKCGGSLGMPEVFKFCPWCGRPVKWRC